MLVVQNVIILSQETRKNLPEEAGQNGPGKLETAAWNIKRLSFFSLDNSKTGSGDHENIKLSLGENEIYKEIYDERGNLYGDCEKKAVNIREKNTHKIWFNSTNDMVFSDLSKAERHFIDESSIIDEENFVKGENFKKKWKAIRNSVRYTRQVNSTFS